MTKRVGTEDLIERVTEVRAWAHNRIRHCREVENRFGGNRASAEETAERRALEAVLRILDGSDDVPA